MGKSLDIYNSKGELILMPVDEWEQFKDMTEPVAELVGPARIAFFAGVMSTSDFFRMLIHDDMEPSKKQDVFDKWFKELEAEIAVIRSVAAILEL